LLKAAETEANNVAEAKDEAAKDTAIAATGQLCSQCHKSYRDKTTPK